MKLSENFVLKRIAGSPVVMPVGDAVSKVHGMIKLNPSAEVIWKALEENKDFDGILDAMKKEFANVSEETLKEDLQYFIGRLREYDILVD